MWAPKLSWAQGHEVVSASALTGNLSPREEKCMNVNSCPLTVHIGLTTPKNPTPNSLRIFQTCLMSVTDSKKLFMFSRRTLQLVKRKKHLSFEYLSNVVSFRVCFSFAFGPKKMCLICWDICEIGSDPKRSTLPLYCCYDYLWKWHLCSTHHTQNANSTVYTEFRKHKYLEKSIHLYG